MNFRNYSMDELAEFIINEPRQIRFIEGCKAFIEKWFDQKHYSQDEVDELIEANRGEAYDEGYDECRQVCRDEAVECIELNLHLDEAARSNLLPIMKMLG